MDGSLNTNWSSTREDFILTRKEYPAARSLDDSEATSSADVQNNNMSLTGGVSSNNVPCPEDNHGGSPEVKRMRLDSSEQYLERNCDIETTIRNITADAIADIDLRSFVKKEIRKQLSNLDKIECECVKIDISFDRIERGLKNMREREKLKQAALLAPAEVHFEDDFTEAYTDFKEPLM